MPDFIALDGLVGQTAAIAPDRIAVIDGERRLSYDGLDELIDRVAAELRLSKRIAGSILRHLLAVHIELEFARTGRAERRKVNVVSGDAGNHHR